MPTELEMLLEAARVREFTPEEKEEHRRSFAYGNTHIENDRITREIINREAENIRAEQGSKVYC